MFFLLKDIRSCYSAPQYQYRPFVAIYPVNLSEIAETSNLYWNFGSQSVIWRFFICWAGIAQLVEQLICNQQVGGSSPFASSSFNWLVWEGLFFFFGAWSEWCRFKWGDSLPSSMTGRFPSGQREQTVNLSAQPSEVRILPSPFWVWVGWTCGNSSVG